MAAIKLKLNEPDERAATGAAKFRNVRSILVISLSCIGDVLLTTPVVSTLRDNFPGARITMVAGKTSYPLMGRLPIADSMVVFDNRGEHKGWKGVLKLIARLRGEKFDMVVDLRNTVIPYLLRARYKLTAHKTHLRLREVRGRHAIDRHLDVVADHGIPVTRRAMRIEIPDADVRKMAERLRALGAPEGAVLTAVYPGAGSKYKEYPPAKLAEALAALGGDERNRFVIVGGADDREAAAAVAAAVPGRAINVAGEFDLYDVAALFRLCRLLISNDSGPMHVGAAVGVPVLALFGPTDAERYGPRGGRHTILWARRDCNPCKSAECGHESCIGEIEPGEIAAAAREMLSSGGGA